jgi:cell division protein FtsW (lipid II flippase)
VAELTALKPLRLGQPKHLLERALIALIFIFLAINMLALTLARPAPDALNDWLLILAWASAFLIGNTLLNAHLPERDRLLFPIIMLLSGWGIILIQRLAPIFADRQTIWLIVSVVALLFTALFPNLLKWLRAYRYILLITGMLLLVATILFGTNPSGQASAPQLWLGIGNVFFQPSEALKVILVTFLASYLAEQYPILRSQALEKRGLNFALSARIVGPILLMWSLSVIILVWQRDLGTAILFFLVFLLLLYATSGFTPLLIGGTFLVIAAGFVAYNLFAVVQLRVDIWLNPWLEPDGRAFQIVQSLFAFANGGVFGLGIAQGSPTFIPVVHSDFIFAALAEEWGLLGVIVTIISIAILISRGFRAAAHLEERPFFSLLAIGLSLLIAVQALMIMGGVLKLIPLTGVTLPFMSYGGSSLLTNFIIIGLLLRLSAESAKDDPQP